ncbi:MAG: carbon-nitrogen hydrolase family protein [Gemmatimonadota bacterium]
MANYVRISTIGAAAAGGNPGTGQEAVDRMIDHWRARFERVLPDAPDLVLVPECCDRYPAHTMAERRAYYAYRGHQVGDYFACVARRNNCYVAYPAVRLLPDGTWRNSVELFDRDGISLGFYNKNYPVITENAEGGILSGAEAPIFACDFGRVGCAICFDLNFDGIRRKYVAARPDLLLFASMYHGGLMQAYWAYSCRAHLATAICGLASGVISPVGQPLAMSTNYFDFVTVDANLDCQVAHLDFNGERLRAMKERYGAGVRVLDPGYLGSVLISSETDEVTSDDLVREFGIELLDDYMARSIAHAEDPEHGEAAPG